MVTTTCLIFDLSEVLIAGLYGVQRELAPVVGRSEDEVLECFGGADFEELLIGRLDEESYLARILARERWPLDVPYLQAAIRRNFHVEVEGMAALLDKLAGRVDLVLLSDHAREWVAYIRALHPIWGLFRRAFFSYELGSLKEDPATFAIVLKRLGRAPGECLFVDDNPVNVRSAEAAGVAGICFESAEKLGAELSARGLL